MLNLLRNYNPKDVRMERCFLDAQRIHRAVKGNSHQVFNSPKPCKCGRQQPHNQSFLFISRKDERQNFLCKIGLTKPPTPRGGSLFLQGKKGGGGAYGKKYNFHNFLFFAPSA